MTDPIGLDSTLARLIPAPHFDEVHAIDIPAPLEKVWSTFTQLDLFAPPLIRLLFRLRGIRLSSHPTPTFSDWHPTWSRVNSMFEPIEVVDPIESSRSELARSESAITLVIRNKKFGLDPRIAIGWDFRLDSIPFHPNRTRVTTETRVFIPDDRFRQIFRAYWLVIRLPSGAIRLEILRYLKNMVLS